MARFLFCAWPYAGHLHPCMALAGRLRERGHQIGFYTGEPGSATVSGEGYEYLGFDALAKYLRGLVADGELYRGLNHRYTTIGATTPWGKLRQVRRLFLEMTAGSLKAQWDDLTRLVTAWRPDVVVTDPMLWAPIVALHESTGIPVAPFSFYAGCLVPGRRMANPGLGLAPATGLASAARNRAANWIMRAVTGPVRSLVNEFRRSLNLAPIDSVPQHSGTMPIYLVASSPEFDYGRTDLGSRLQYVGPCLWEPANGANDIATELDNRRPVVYVSEGTAQIGVPFLIRPSLDALRDEEVQVIVTTGRQRSQESLRLDSIPDNARVLEWVSHQDLIPRTRVVVTTGGSNTVRQALASGVPLLVCPLEWDQLENAQRVAGCGAGIRIDRSQCTPEAIRKAVCQLISTPGYRESAQRIGAGLRRLENSPSVLERLEALA